MQADNRRLRFHSAGKPRVPVVSPSGTEPGMSSERNLWSAVLGLAIEDLTDSRTSTQTRRGIRVWLALDNYDPASFLWICEPLEIDALSVRRRVLKLMKGTSFDFPVSLRKEEQRKRV